jgi:hypothetical protein
MMKRLPKTVAEKLAVPRRAFKTAWFAKEAYKAKITDEVLCRAMQQVMQGQADDLGGGVFKKRLNDNMHRSIILAKADIYWIYVYLYAKKDRENINREELSGFKKLAKDYCSAGEDKISALLKEDELLEICHDE